MEKALEIGTGSEFVIRADEWEYVLCDPKDVVSFEVDLYRINGDAEARDWYKIELICTRRLAKKGE